MAKGDVYLKGTGDFKDMQKQFNKVHKEMVKMRADLEEARKQSKQLQAAAKRGFQDMEKGARGYGRASGAATKTAAAGMRANIVQARGMVGALVGAAGVRVAVTQVTAAYREWSDEMRKAGEVAKKYHEKVIKDLSEAGDLARGKELSAFFASVQGVKKEDVAAAYAGVAGGAPGLSIERRKKLAAATSRLAPTGQSMEEVGTLVGELAEIMPQKTADDLSDLALSLRQQAGKNISKVVGPQFLKSVRILRDETGMTLEAALGFALAAVQKDLRPELIISALSKAGRYKGKGAFGKASMGERVTMLLQDEKLRKKVLGEQAVKFGQLRAEDVVKYTQALRQAQTQDIVKQEVAAMSGFGTGAQKMKEYRELAKYEKTPEYKEAEFLGEQQRRYEQRVEQQKRGKWILPRLWETAKQKYAETKTAAFGPLVPGMSFYESAAAEQGFTEFARSEQKLREQAQREAGQPIAKPTPVDKAVSAGVRQGVGRGLTTAAGSLLGPVGGAAGSLYTYILGGGAPSTPTRPVTPEVAAGARQFDLQQQQLKAQLQIVQEMNEMRKEQANTNKKLDDLRTSQESTGRRRPMPAAPEQHQ